jgi:hypothetical protein
MNPVQAAIRAHVEEDYPRWRRRTAYDPVATRAGERHLGAHVAALLAPALTAVGLHLAEEDGGRRLFVTRSGRHLTRDALRDQITGALTGHPDAALRDSVSSAAFFEHLGDRLPYFEGDEITRSRDPREPRGTHLPPSLARRARRARNYAAEVESSRAFLTAVRPRLIGSPIPRQDLYAAALSNIERREGEPIADGDGHLWTRPRRRVFYTVADEEYGEPRRRARGWTYVVEAVARAVRRLSPRTAETLRLAGVLDPEAYADDVVARIGEPGPAPEPGPVVEAADALPDAVAGAMASADDPRQALVQIGKFWSERHPETRPAIAAAARLFKDGLGDELAEAVRHRVALAIALDASA